MAINNRATNQTTINTNIPDNTTELITPALDREARTDLNDSMFNKIDEPRDQAQDIVYVSPDGLVTGKNGDQSSCFSTFASAISAVPGGGIVKALGGDYTESIVLNKEGITLDISGCRLTGRIVIGERNLTINARGALITGNGSQNIIDSNTFPTNQSGLRVIGGVWNGLTQPVARIQDQVSGCFFRNCVFTSSILGNVVLIESQEANFQNCIINATNAGNAYAVFVEGVDALVRLYNCFITSTGGNAVGVFADSTLRITKGSLTGGNYGLFTTNTVGNTVDLIAEDVTIIGGSNYAVYLDQLADNVRFTRCLIAATSDIEAVRLDTNRSVGKDTLFEYCTFFAGPTKQIFSQAESDTSVTYVNKCSFNKVAFVYTAQIIETDTCYQPNTPLIL